MSAVCKTSIITCFKVVGKIMNCYIIWLEQSLRVKKSSCLVGFAVLDVDLELRFSLNLFLAQIIVPCSDYLRFPAQTNSPSPLMMLIFRINRRVRAVEVGQLESEDSAGRVLDSQKVFPQKIRCLSFVFSCCSLACCGWRFATEEWEQLKLARWN